MANNQSGHIRVRRQYTVLYSTVWYMAYNIHSEYARNSITSKCRMNEKYAQSGASRMAQSADTFEAAVRRLAFTDRPFSAFLLT